MGLEDRRVLSIQSHVVHGYVGNKSATFPLQLHGFEVDAINSVQLSNHTGYKTYPGQVLTSVDVDSLFNGLKTNGLLHKYTHLLTGYIGSASFLDKVCDIIKELKSVNSDILYVCDPVMGDNGKMYVPEDLLPIYQEKIVPLADIITPNQFEAQLLTGITIKNEEDAIDAMDALHEMGAKTVVLSSTELGSDSVMVAYGSHLDKETGKRSRVKLEFPKLASAFTGTGDLFAASLLIWMTKTNKNLKEACEKTVATLQAVLKRTMQHTQACKKGDKPTAPEREMRLIQSKSDIEQPTLEFKCVDI